MSLIDKGQLVSWGRPMTFLTLHSKGRSSLFLFSLFLNIPALNHMGSDITDVLVGSRTLSLLRSLH